jgi:hypothetical protein
MSTPNTSPLPMASTTKKFNAAATTSAKNQQIYFNTPTSSHSMPSSAKEFHPDPALMPTIHSIRETTLIALTEPFLMAWCQEINQDTLAADCLGMPDYWFGFNSVHNM